MYTGFVLMLANGVKPSPAAEVAALADDCTARRSTHLLSTKTVDAAKYQPGFSRVAIIEGGTRQLIAHAVFDSAIPYVAGKNLGPRIYDHLCPDNPQTWIKLWKFVLVSPPDDIAVLGWSLPDGTPLTADTIPPCQGGQHFKVKHP